MKMIVTVLKMWTSKYASQSYYVPCMMLACPSTLNESTWQIIRLFDRVHSQPQMAIVDATIWAEAEGVAVDLTVGDGDKVQPVAELIPKVTTIYRPSDNSADDETEPQSIETE